MVSFEAGGSRSNVGEIPSPKSCPPEADEFQLLRATFLPRGLPDDLDDLIEALMDRSPMYTIRKGPKLRECYSY